MTRGVAIFALMCVLHLPSARAAEQPCEKQTGPLMTSKSSWNAIYKTAVALPSDCFDGYFGEGISDVMVRKMGHDWLGFIRILSRHQEDAKFFSLVLKSINATLNPDDIVTVYKRARTSCPAALQEKCNEITARSKAALADYDPPRTVP
jgi:hypothetical protein